AAPALLEAAAASDPQLSHLVRAALRGLQHYDLPLGVKIVPDPLFPSCSWVAAFHEKLESPNFFMRDWRLRKALRSKWTKHLQVMVTRVERVSSWSGLKE